MKNKLERITISNFTTESGVFYPSFTLSYQVFGCCIKEAPVVFVNHALTGNSEVSGENGWWNNFIGDNKTINTNHYAILCFNVPGNGYDGVVIDNYLDFTARDIARLFLEGIRLLEIASLFAIIAGSVGAGIAWEMLALSPKITREFISIAADWKATDWIIANCYVQDQILINSTKPVQDARVHAMLLYRTPESFKARFDRSINQDFGVFNIESWLKHHGEKLQERFELLSYKMMNQLLRSIDITRGREGFGNIISKIEANFHIVAIDTDLLFEAVENKATYLELRKRNKTAFYYEIQSIHGHDAFLIEYKQLDILLGDIFK